MLETIKRALGHKYTPPVVAGALLAALDVPLVAGVFAITLFVVVLEAVKQAAREGTEKAIHDHVYGDEDKPDGL
tara:strand:+ start:1939 stop:2160 length:222 start_codon:yes stop_codon:yes gene_type:complete